MELRYRFVIYLGVLILALSSIILFVMRKKKKAKYKGGKKFSGEFLMKEDPYFQKKVRQYRILRVILTGVLILSILASLVLAARPYSTTFRSKENYNRDIMLCIDVSSSVNELNLKLVHKLQDTVKALEGERFGIVIFNTSPILLSPLTTDYDYILDILSHLEKCLKLEVAGDYTADDFYYLDSYLMSGTLIGAEERGSSLIGDGLAASAYDFPNLEEERTRVIIFSTDNDLQGDPLVTLEEAGIICKKNNIKVYGIGTKEMSNAAKKDMKTVVEKTGGIFYLEEDSGTVKQIVESIEKQEKSISKESKEIIKEDQPVLPFILLLISVSTLFITGKISKM